MEGDQQLQHQESSGFSEETWSYSSWSLRFLVPAELGQKLHHQESSATNEETWSYSSWSLRFMVPAEGGQQLQHQESSATNEETWSYSSWSLRFLVPAEGDQKLQRQGLAGPLGHNIVYKVRTVERGILDRLMFKMHYSKLLVKIRPSCFLTRYSRCSVWANFSQKAASAAAGWPSGGRNKYFCRPHHLKEAKIESIEWFLEGQAFSWSYVWLLAHPPPPPVSSTGDTPKTEKERQLSDGGRRWGRSRHTTPRRPGPL